MRNILSELYNVTMLNIKGHVGHSDSTDRQTDMIKISLIDVTLSLQCAVEC